MTTDTGPEAARLSTLRTPPSSSGQELKSFLACHRMDPEWIDDLSDGHAELRSQDRAWDAREVSNCSMLGA